MTLGAGVSLVYGLVGLLATQQVARIYGSRLGVDASQFLAAAYLGYAVTNWFARGTRDPVARRAITLGNFTGWAISLILALLDVLSGFANPLLWPTLALCAVFTAGWGYFAFARKPVRQDHVDQAVSAQRVGVHAGGLEWTRR
jgi:hypothetical protein